MPKLKTYAKALMVLGVVVAGPVAGLLIISTFRWLCWASGAEYLPELAVILAGVTTLIWWCSSPLWVNAMKEALS